MTDELPLIKQFAAFLKSTGETFFLADQIQRGLGEFLASLNKVDTAAGRAVRRTFRGCPEMLIEGDTLFAVLRPRMGHKRCVRISPESEHIEEIGRGEYLQVKDSYVQGHELAGKRGLVIDFSPYFRDFPKINEPSEMGEGISFLNRHLSAQMYQNPDVFGRALLRYLRDRELDGRPILANRHLSDPETLLGEQAAVRSWLGDLPPDTPYTEVEHELRVHGFEAGWGRTVGQIREQLRLLAQVLESSDPARFERLLGRLPVIRTVLMVSPHGWFAQDDVLGKPDTGGQVTYVLDQARALESSMRHLFYESGVDAQPKVVVLTRLIPDAEGTTCNLPREQIHGTEDGWIIRAPFRNDSGDVIPHWISRFQIWPYLEQFAEDARNLVVTELLGRPDLIVGHYSDGNLVAHRLAEDLDVTHCACVHALEKTKYILSDMHWGEMEHDYRFSMQFTADLLAYNSADFIVSSSYREVGGTESEQGMIEAYDVYSMPGLYRVQSGLDPRLARHNIVPPGASEEHFFPNTDSERRVEGVTEALTRRFFQAEPTEMSLGHLEDPDRPPIFAMARMDKIKNLSGLVELFGRSPGLREHANLLLVSSVIDASASHDQEEIAEVNRVHELIGEHNLEGHIRWCAARLDKVETGEIYRIAADRRGVFAQPAFMETFGLTVVEAMACGLPVVVTCFGGPSEIVIDDDCGYVRNPNDQTAFAGALEAVVTDQEVWNRFSQAGIRRVQEAFTWGRHATKLLELTNVYTYWNYIDVMNRQALDRYVHTLYHILYRPRTRAMLEETT
ncbi:Mannosylfructose-phosphate synthase [Maioricimonas rarisocia]|uniref:Sucrose synthase n=1 Tax=Maioricimonas rarisocia TaxID=2528026 RepID=A0A517YZY7_9PLAN|nr:sucrose synthase [Maioricimonas rarisocia]QDU35791.1 Mannosylfructose-phosphate synthase [Maioricimonas rarisocia]